MLRQKIYEGDSVVLSPMNKQTGLESYTSKVETVYNNATVLIRSPFISFDYARLPITELYWLNLKNSMIRYKAAIWNYLSKNKAHFLQLKLLDEGEKVQRQEVFQLSCQIPSEFKLLKRGGVNRLISNESNEGVLCKLSADGMKLMTNLEMEEEDSVLIPFRLDCNE
ncbi:MAG: hypothetical protein FWG82_07175, partial [Oscillospiraceae bacterium]|nr:hypothetical protein [Oscillospiraceae bacterium]